MRLPKRKTLALTAGILALLGTMGCLWNWFASPTRIAVVNYRDFQYAEFLDAKDNPFICIDRIELDALPDTNIGSYTAVFVFGMGLNLDDSGKEAIRRGISGGAYVHVTSSTSADSDLSNLSGDNLRYVSGYFDNGGRKNTRALFNYCRRALDGKALFSEPVAEPQEIPQDVLYHLGEDTFFTSYEDYQRYYERQGLYREGRPRVCFLTSIVGPRSIDRAYADDMIGILEARGINVYPVAGFLKRLEFMQAVEPDLVICVPHGRLAPGRTDEAVAWLGERNIPLLCPIDASVPYDEWVTAQQGMSGGMLSQSIVMTELDGGIEPFAISAQFPGDGGLNVSQGIPDRMERFASRVEHWLNLQTMANADKKIAIVYYKGPGRNAMTAGGLEVAPSLLNVLRHLKRMGYATGDLPETDEAFAALIQAHGPVLGPYAKGAFEVFLRDGDPELVPTGRYLSWVREQLTPEAYADVVRQYGDAPGDYLAVARNDSTFIALPRVRFGNIVLVPQLLPALGDDTSKLVHGAKQAPPHPYLAEYLWIRHGFGADAIIHFGTHGSFEFTPWKQTALSSNDWPDALIGDLPHPYLYVIDNIGEALIAKRRSYAAIVSHLPPPFVESDLYGALTSLDAAVEGYESADDPALRAEYLDSIRRGVSALDLHKDLGWPETDAAGISDARIEELHDYLHTIGQEKITNGLYTIGKPYADDDLLVMSRLMAIDPITYSLARLDVETGVIPDSLLQDAAFIAGRYRETAFDMIDQIIAGAKTTNDFISAADLKRLEDWDSEHKTITADELFASMLGMADSGPADTTAARGGYDPGRIEELVLQVTVDPRRRELVSGWKDDESFAQASSLLDPDGMRKAKNIAKLIEPMREMLALIEQPEIHELLTAMQHPDACRLVFQLLDDPGLQEKREREALAVRERNLAAALGNDHKAALVSIADTGTFTGVLASMREAETDSVLARLRFFRECTGLADDLNTHGGQDARAMAAILRNPHLLADALEAAERHRASLDEREETYVSLVRDLRDVLDNAAAYRNALGESTERELAGLVNVLSGGYVEPSSGGDPIVNPKSVPTGRNLFAIDAESTPTAEAWSVGTALAERTIQQKLDATGEYPKKVAVTLWGGEFIRTRGVSLAMIFHFLGVEPVRNSRGVVHDVALIPGEKLGRPRIDVVVQTSGQFRDIAASRISLINKAVRLASGADDSPGMVNNVKDGTLAAERVMKQNGLSPLDAQVFSTARVFGGVNGGYGSGIMGMVEAGDTWESDDEIAEQYLQNMGAVYTDGYWGHYTPGLFEGALQHTDTVVHNRSSNTWGPLSLDHVYEFMGGISATVRHVTGADPDAYFSDLRNMHNPTVQTARQAIWTETRTTLLNPKYIAALQEGGASSAETFAETFRNTYGWNVMKPNEIDEELWEGLYDVYVRDAYDLGVEAFFRDKNPYALQEMTAVMLETIRKGYWNADRETRENLASLHAALVRDHAAGCSGFVCDNASLRAFIGALVTSELRSDYASALDAVRTGSEREPVEGMTLEKETLTLDAVKKAVTENAAALILLLCIMVLFSAAVVAGARRRA